MAPSRKQKPKRKLAKPEPGQEISQAAKNIFEEKLIDLVKNHPVIFKKNHPNHKNTLILSNAWESIYAEFTTDDPPCAKSGEECAYIWKNLWAQYLGHKRRCKGKTGDPGGSRPFYRHENVMRQFEDTETHDKTFCNIPNDETGAENSSLTTEAIIDVDQEGNILSVSSAAVTTEDVVRLESSPEFQSRSHVKHSSKKKNDLSMNEFESKVCKLLSDEPGGASDEFAAFGNTIAAKIRRIDSRDHSAAEDLQIDIMYLIRDKEKTLH